MNNMKKLLIFYLTFFIFQTGFSQKERLSREKVNAYKKLFLSDKLKLNPNIEIDFWKAYKSYEDSLYQLWDNNKNNFRKVADEVSFSDPEYAQLINDYMDYEKKKVELRGQLISELREVLSPRKTYELFRLEEDFRREMMKKLRESRQITKN
ncbi:MAG: hypothetical protein CMD12_02345 [Flavobacteriales bacterium]|nr:hypothetical protein [Flavobacteriales bacterium]MBK56880.1 hypothetical protein [Flavobacteriaceae bacterium]|tara:strand:- start:86 stop:541 length:456 start_codon:yes stop_codon:yes gene_type:complete